MTATNPAAIPTPLGTTPARKFLLEVNTGTVGTPTWTAVNYVQSLKPDLDNPNFEDDSDYGSAGWQSMTKTSAGWGFTATMLRKIITTAIAASNNQGYDAGQEALRLASIGQFGAANVSQVRIFEYTPGTGPRLEAYSGVCVTSWEEQGGDTKALDTVQVTGQGRGPLTQIAHPYPAA